MKSCLTYVQSTKSYSKHYIVWDSQLRTTNQEQRTLTRILRASNTVISATAYANRYLFTGREWLRRMGIYDYRNRVYSPDLGRFLQSDPIRFDAGDVNLYRYVANNTINKVDPLGLDFRYGPYDNEKQRDNANDHPQNPSNPDATGESAPPPIPPGPSNPGAAEGLNQIADGVTGLIPYYGPFKDIEDIVVGICKLIGLCPPDDPCEIK